MENLIPTWPPACAKCRGTDIAVRHIFDDYTHEHIAAKCRNCEYKWTLPCADAQPIIPAPDAEPTDDEYVAALTAELGVSPEYMRELEVEIDRTRKMAEARRRIALGWRERALKAEGANSPTER